MVVEGVEYWIQRKGTPKSPFLGLCMQLAVLLELEELACWWEELSGGCCQVLGRLVLPLAPGN